MKRITEKLIAAVYEHCFALSVVAIFALCVAVKTRH